MDRQGERIWRDLAEAKNVLQTYLNLKFMCGDFILSSKILSTDVNKAYLNYHRTNHYQTIV